MKVQILCKHQQISIVDTRGRILRDANRFLNSLRIRGLSSHTIRAYAYDLKSLFSWLRSIKKVRDLTKHELSKFIDYQRINQSSPRSINRRLTTAELFYRFITGTRLLASVSCSKFRGQRRDRTLGLFSMPHKENKHLRVKVPKTIITPLTVNQVQSLLALFTRYRDLALIYLMLLCGLRAQEILNIEKGDFQPSEKTIRVHGKGNKERILPLPEIVCDLVAKYLYFERPKESLTNALFVALQGRQRGKPITIAGLRSLFRVRRTHSGLANIHPHLLRHTFGSAMASHGMSLPVLQRLMGHAFPETTMQYVNFSMNDVIEQFTLATTKLEEIYT